jgi:hypothetical protein
MVPLKLHFAQIRNSESGQKFCRRMVDEGRPSQLKIVPLESDEKPELKIGMALGEGHFANEAIRARTKARRSV